MPDDYSTEQLIQDITDVVTDVVPDLVVPAIICAVIGFTIAWFFYAIDIRRWVFGKRGE